MMLKKHWWKALGILLVVYTIITGFLSKVPELAILHETIRNLYFHVTMWFGMMIIFTVSVVYSIKYLSGFDLKNDMVASEAANTGMLFGTLGITTGMIWANFTWGDWWVNDPKLNGAAITMLIYLAYLVLRGSMDDDDKRAKVSAVYNIFAFTMLIVFLLILPRMTDSLHPGNGGNPGFDAYDLNNNMRMIFYPAVIGWSLVGVWITNIGLRIRMLRYKRLNDK